MYFFNMKIESVGFTVGLPAAYGGKILELMREGLVVVDCSNLIIEVNAASIKLFGASDRCELLGKGISQFWENADDFSDVVSILSLYRSIDNLENTFVAVNGGRFTGSYSATVVDDLQQKTSFKIFFIKDITASVRLHENFIRSTAECAKLNKDLDQFLYTVTHDLKAPLRAINHLSQWIQEDLFSFINEETEENFKTLRLRVARMESMINSLSVYSKISKQDYQQEPVSVLELLTDLLNELSIAEQAKVKIEGHLPNLVTNRSALYKIFVNLIENAIRFNEKKEKHITISCRENCNSYEFTVEDNGPGIPEEHRERIFRVFETLQSKDKLETTGMGLPITKAILEKINGTIGVQSQIGIGSKFIFTLAK